MFVDLTPEQYQLRMKIRGYVKTLMNPEIRVKLRGSEGGSEYRRLVKQMGSDSWLAVGWLLVRRLVINTKIYIPNL